MKNLMDIYDSIDNPMDNLSIVRKIIDAYFKSREDKNESFYGILIKENSKEKEYAKGWIEKDRDNFEAALFNTYKDNIQNMTLEEYEKNYGTQNGYDSIGFRRLQEFLRKMEDVETHQDIVEKFKKKIDPIAKKAFDDFYDYDPDQQGWSYVDSYRLGMRKKVEPKHRLYINTDATSYYALVSTLCAKLMENDLPIKLKYPSGGDVSRDDTIVMWTNDEDLPKYIKILREFAEENQEWINEKAYKPPILTGVIDGWIGYGSEPKETGKISFNKKRKELLRSSIDRVIARMFLDNVNLNDSKNNLRQQICEQLTEKCLRNSQDRGTTRFLPETKDGVKTHINSVFDKMVQKLITKNDIEEELDRGMLFNGFKFSINKGELADVIAELSYKHATIDEKFVKDVQAEIKRQSKEYGIDENKFCFDIQKVKEMEEYDSQHGNVKKTTQNESKTQISEKYNIHTQNTGNNNTSAEQQEIDDILKKILNLTPENRKKAFRVLDSLENEQTKAERE